MLRNYCIMALRHLRKGGIFTAINIFGLAAGLAACLLIALFVRDEYSYDRYHEHADRIFRVVSDIHINGNGINGVYVPAPMGPSLVQDQPGIEKMVRIRRQPDMLVRKGNEMVTEVRAVFADPTLFEIFTIPLVAGNPHSALVKPYTMAISASAAKKYFSRTDVLGETLVTDDTTVYTITGVFRDLPASSHFHFDFIKAMSEKQLGGGQQWINLFCSTYLLARPGVQSGEIDQMLAAAVDKYVGPEMQQELHSSPAELAKNGDGFRYYSMPLTRIHLYSDVKGEFEPNGNIRTVRIFMFVAIFILLMAVANFMNLSTARGAGRFREMGVRKVLGGSRRDLIFRSLVESILASGLAMALAVSIVMILLPYFNRLSGKELSLSAFGSAWVLIALVAVSVIVGLLAGSYPAFYLSAMQAIQGLRGQWTGGRRAGVLRNGLVIFEYTIVIVLIIGVLVVESQLDFIRRRDPGYNRRQVLTIHHTNSLGSEVRAFREEVEALQGVENSTMSASLPNSAPMAATGYFKTAGSKASETLLLNRWVIDVQYVPTLEMRMLRGRNFSALLPTDSSGVLINETAARLIGYPDPIGKKIYRGSEPGDAYPILGVVKDFNAGTLHASIEPLVFHLGADDRALSLRIHSADIPRLIGVIRERYQSLNTKGGQAFSYSFMEDDFNNLYRSDERSGDILFSFAILAIVIACLGLFGLVAYAAEQRSKEFGIRKVLGAGTVVIVGLLSRDLLRLVFLAALIACPLGWWIMHRWLEDFAYRTAIGWWVFGLAGLLTLAVTAITIGLRAFRAAVSNPVEVLRTI